MMASINFSIRAPLPSLAEVTVRSIGATLSSTSIIPITATTSNHRYNQTRHFARPRRPSSLRNNKRRGGRGRTIHHNNIGNDNNNNNILTNNPSPQHAKKNVLIIGSQGELGKTLVSHFGTQMNWNVIGADVLDPSLFEMKKGMDKYISLPQDGSVADLSVALYRGVSSYLSSTPSKSNDAASLHLDAIVCASGGWMGDIDKYTYEYSIDENEQLEDIDPEEEFIRESSEVCEHMMKVNYYPIVAGGMIGQQFLTGSNHGLFVIIGASAALSPTPGMMGYGAAKAASHHYLQTYGTSVSEENGSTSVGILPLMLDTPANRAMMGDEDDDRYSKMVKPIHIATEIGQWIKNPHLRPHSGSLVKVMAKNRMDGSGGAAFHLVR